MESSQARAAVDTLRRMSNVVQTRESLLHLLREKSVRFGDFTLSSGAKSSYYIDCRMTTTDAHGSLLVGQVMLDLIRREEARAGIRLTAIGGLTAGADPVTFAVGMTAALREPERPLQMFIVRKEPKAHGEGKLIEGNFQAGDVVVIVDDVITGGGSTLKAIQAVREAGGRVAFAAVLVDRQQGGTGRIAEAGVPVLAAFTRDELLGSSLFQVQTALAPDR